jgi:predicted CXXCH cytochrome family protein
MRFILPAFVVLILVGGSVALVYGIVGRPEEVDQPIAFNHAVHLNEAALQCDACHTDAESSVYAGLPGKDVCLDCHDIDEEEDEANPGKVRLFSFVDLEEDIPWARVALTKPDVFFSHRRHVAAAGLDCLECHADQPTLTSPPPTVQLVMTMDDCIACHEANRASTDCLVCHR